MKHNTKKERNTEKYEDELPIINKKIKAKKNKGSEDEQYTLNEMLLEDGEYNRKFNNYDIV